MIEIAQEENGMNLFFNSYHLESIYAQLKDESKKTCLEKIIHDTAPQTGLIYTKDI